jgi:putative flippase GtrA
MKVLAFLLVGGLNTLLGITSYWLLLRLGAPFPIASGLSLALGIVIGFHAHRRLVFRREGLFLRYLVIWVCIYALTNFLIWILQRWLGPFLAGAALMPVNATAGYLALRHFVFRDPTSGVPDATDPPVSYTRNPLEPPSD